MSHFSSAFDIVRETVEAGAWPSAVFGVTTASGIVALDAFGSTAGRTAATGLSTDFSDAHTVPDAAAAGLNLARFERLRSPGAGLAGTADDLLKLGAELLCIMQGEAGILQPSTPR